MKNFYFSNCSFSREPVIEDGEYNIDLQKQIELIGEHKYGVTLTTTIEKKDIQIGYISNGKHPIGNYKQYRRWGYFGKW